MSEHQPKVVATMGHTMTLVGRPSISSHMCILGQSSLATTQNVIFSVTDFICLAQYLL